MVPVGDRCAKRRSGVNAVLESHDRELGLLSARSPLVDVVLDAEQQHPSHEKHRLRNIREVECLRRMPQKLN